MILVLVLVLSCVAHVCAYPLALTHIYLRAQVTLHRFASDDEAIAMANVTKYGLAGSVWTSDERRGYDVASRIESGILWVNCWLYAIPHPRLYILNSTISSHSFSIATWDCDDDSNVSNSTAALTLFTPRCFCSLVCFANACGTRYRDLRTPFGGVKQSGVGREGGEWSIGFFSETRNVCVKLATPRAAPGGKGVQDEQRPFAFIAAMIGAAVLIRLCRP